MNAYLLAFVVIGACVLYALVGVIGIRRLLRGKVQEGHNDVLVPIFATAGVIYAVLLAFLVIAVWTAYDNAHDNVTEESTQLTALYRLTAGMKYFAERDYMRARIRDYTKDVVEEEWDALARTGKASEKARADVGKMYQFYHVMPWTQSSSAVNQEYLRELTNITHERNRRIFQANDALPPIMWFGLIAGGAVMIGMAFFLYMERAWPQVLMVCVLSALIGCLLFVTMVLNRPFVGPMAIKSESFEALFNLYDSVDRGN